MGYFWLARKYPELPSERFHRALLRLCVSPSSALSCHPKSEICFHGPKLNPKTLSP